MRVIVAGSRDITDYNLVVKAIQDCGFIITEVVCGLANGPDLMGKRWAWENNIPVKEFPAKWDDLSATPCKIKVNKFGKEYNIFAGKNRNLEMAEYAKPNGALIAIHNGSSGTANMIKLAKEHNLKVFEVRI